MRESNETDLRLTPLHLFPNPINCAISTWMQVSFLFCASAHKCRKNLWFDRKRFEICQYIIKKLVNTGHVKTKGVGKLDSFEHIRWYSSTKADRYSSCYLFLCLSEQVLYFHETDYCIILSHYLQLLAKVLQNRCSSNTLYNPQENNCVGVSF